MPKRTALLVCNSPVRGTNTLRNRKKNQGFRHSIGNTQPFTLNFSYKNDSTAPQKCQGRQNIDSSIIFPSFDRHRRFRERLNLRKNFTKKPSSNLFHEK